MLIKKTTLRLRDDSKSDQKSLNVTKIDIQKINSRIAEDIKKNEQERLKGLEAIKDKVSD